MRIPRCSLALAALATTALFAQAQTDYSKIQIKANKLFAESPLVRIGRLSVVPLTAQQYKALTGE